MLLSLQSCPSASPGLQPLAHDRGGVVTTLPRPELLPAPAPPPHKPVLAPREPKDALLEVIISAAVAAAPLQQVVDGEVVAVDDADVSAARLVRPASWVEVNMTQRLLMNIVFTYF